MDRASHFNDDEVIHLLKQSFTPVAVDEWYHIRRQDPEGEFYRKVVYQREGLSPEVDRSTQGFYVFDPEGALWRGWNNRDLPKLKRYLKEVVRKYAAPNSTELKSATEATSGTDARFARGLEDGGVVVEVFSKIIRADWPPAKDEWQEHFRQSTGRDHLWILKDEVSALAAGELPQQLVRRIARYHLVDNTRGEPPLWQADEVRENQLRLAPEAASGHRLDGSVILRTDNGKRAYEASGLGRIETKGGKLTRFDVVFRGEFAGEGTYTPGAPPGKFTLAIVFRLAQGGEADKVPPQGARDLRDYLKPAAD